MQLKTLLEDDDAVSPVIGVILMVAITVILAAVIGTFVLGLGDQVQETAPSAQFSFDYDSDTAGGELTMTHDGGDSIEGSALSVSNDGTTWDIDNTPTDGFFVASGSSSVTAGTSMHIDVNNDSFNPDEEVRIIWSADGGDRSSTLATWEQ
jgi:flagellin-like protein